MKDIKYQDTFSRQIEMQLLQKK